MTTLHPYAITSAGRTHKVLACSYWHAVDQGLLIFGHLGGITARRIQQGDA